MQEQSVATRTQCGDGGQRGGRDFIAELPEPMRAFLTARHLDRVSQLALAKRLGITEWKVKAIEKRLRKELRARLKRAGVDWGNSDG